MLGTGRRSAITVLVKQRHGSRSAHLGKLDHEQDIWNIVKQEAKTDFARCYRSGMNLPKDAWIVVLTSTQTDARSATIEVKIKKLDGELMRYKEQMSKLRNGPGKVLPFYNTRTCTKLNTPDHPGSYPATGSAHAKAEAHVRIAISPTYPADF
jgi:hypothetical protein